MKTRFFMTGVVLAALLLISIPETCAAEDVLPPQNIRTAYLGKNKVVVWWEDPSNGKYHFDSALSNPNGTYVFDRSYDVGITSFIWRPSEYDTFAHWGDYLVLRSAIGNFKFGEFVESTTSPWIRVFPKINELIYIASMRLGDKIGYISLYITNNDGRLPLHIQRSVDGGPFTEIWTIYERASEPCPPGIGILGRCLKAIDNSFPKDKKLEYRLTPVGEEDFILSTVVVDPSKDDAGTKPAAVKSTADKLLPPTAIKGSIIEDDSSEGWDLDVRWVDVDPKATGVTLEVKQQSEDGEEKNVAIKDVPSGVGQLSNLNVGGWGNFTYVRFRSFGTGSGGKIYSDWTEWVECGSQGNLTAGLSKPAKLTAISEKSCSVSLDWQQPTTNPGQSLIERRVGGAAARTASSSLQADSSFKLIARVPSPTKHFEDSGLSNGTFIYRIRAVNDMDASNYSDTATATIAFKNPSVFRAKAISSEEVSLTWQNNGPYESGVELEMTILPAASQKKWKIQATKPNLSQSATAPAKKTIFTAGQTTTYAIKGLLPNTTYEFRIKPAGCPAAKVLTATATTGNASVPNPPVELTGRAVTSRIVELKWSDKSENETGFVIEEKEGTGQFHIVSAEHELPNTVSKKLFDRISGTQYAYRVKAVDGNLSSSYSNEVQITTPKSTLFPAPTDLVAKILPGDELQLKWKDNADFEDGYYVEMNKEGSGYTPFYQGAANTTSYTTGLEPNKTYVFRVRAFTGSEKSNPSNEVKIIMPASTVPPKVPKSMYTTISTDGITYVWRNVSNNADGYLVERKKGNESFNQLADLRKRSDYYYLDKSVEKGTTYSYRVKAYNSVGSSPYSDEISVATPQLIAKSALAATAAKTNKFGNQDVKTAAVNATGGVQKTASIKQGGKAPINEKLATVTATATTSTLATAHAAPLPDITAANQVTIADAAAAWDKAVNIDAKKALSMRNGICAFVVKYAVRNAEQGATGNFKSAWTNSAAPGTWTKDWPSLAPGASMSQTDTINLKPGQNLLTLSLDQMNQVKESNENNNQFRLTVNLTGQCGAAGVVALPAVAPKLPAVQQPVRR
jgi:titin